MVHQWRGMEPKLGRQRGTVVWIFVPKTASGAPGDEDFRNCPRVRALDKIRTSPLPELPRDRSVADVCSRLPGDFCCRNPCGILSERGAVARPCSGGKL